MRISFYGAAGEVTGSCYLVETTRARVLVDFGLHQGGPESESRNRRLPPIDIPGLDAVVITHAHIDHTGRLPLLEDAGYRGVIHCTEATRDLAEIMLQDSARLQEADAQRRSQRNARKGRPGVRPLYTEAQAQGVLKRFRPAPYDQMIEIAPGVQARFVNSGHILGAASIEVRVTEDGADGRQAERLIVFSGDVGPRNVPLLPDPVCPLPRDGREPDLVILESTYGDRDHRSLDDTIEEAAGLMRESIWAKERVFIPAFAVGRSQLVVYYLGLLQNSGRVPEFPVYLDSPMAIAAMSLYRRYAAQLDKEANAATADGHFPLEIKDLRLSETPEQSKAINSAPGPIVVIAGSGMCNGGRILHHLRNALWRRDTRVIIAGYQADGTLGRQLVQGATKVRIFGETIAVRAKIHTLGGLSAHAGQTELLRWADDLLRPCTRKPRLILTHGEERPRFALREKLVERTGLHAGCPHWGAWVEV